MKATGGVSLKTWTPAAQRRTPDNIVSSKYTTAKAFVPSYEKEGEPRIEQLLANDYQRIWWKEKQIWDTTIAEKIGRNKKILPRMLVKRKVPTCVTVKYQTRADRWMGRKKQDQKCALKKKESDETSSAEDLKSAKDDDIKLEKCEETKSEKHEETQSEKHEEIKSEKHEETQSNKYKETQSEKHEETQSEKHEETQSEKHEETQSESEKEGEDEREKKREKESRSDCLLASS